MNCAEFDLKAYALGEAAGQERRRVEDHLRACAGCREELERVALTRAALRALPEQEMPRRIAFVSDQVFEPGWWRRFWRSGPRLGFASAALLAAAIVAHGFLARPPAAAPPPPGVDMAAIERRIEAAVTEAVAAAEARQPARIAEAVREAERRMEFERRAEMAAVESNFELLRKQFARMYLASSQIGGAQ